MTGSRIALGCLVIALVGLGTVSALGQDPVDSKTEKADSKTEKADSKTKAADSKTEKEAAGEKKPAPAEPAQPAQPAAGKKADSPATSSVAAPEAAQEFDKLLGDWKSILKELRTIRQQNLTADAAAGKELERQWNELITRGDALLPQLRAAGVQAYSQSRGDRSIERFLLQVLEDDIVHDQYEDAAALSKSLLDAGCEVKKVLDHAAVAAFCTNNFEGAEKYFLEAQNAGVLGETGTKFLALLPEYKEFWKAEQELRAKESAAQGEEQLPRVKIATTKGEMVVELFENEAPGAVGNFISLVEKKYYDGLTYHRVLPGFMAQGGCPKGDGTGGPGYNIYCECQQPNYRRHFRGTLSMAHAGRDTGGSQFFITFVPTAHLNGQHTAFGRVVEGIDVLGRLQRIDPSNKEDNAKIPDKILSIEILRKRSHDYVPSKVQ